jgi:hypothetical protein
MPRRNRRHRPWGNILGKPIVLYRHDWGEKLAQEERYKKMLRLKEHYRIEGEMGWRPWYALVVAVVSEFDDGLMFVDPAPRKKTSPRWRGAEGLQLLDEVSALRERHPHRSERWCLSQLIRRLPHRLGGMSLDELVVRYSEAKKHHATKRRQLNDRSS